MSALLSSLPTVKNVFSVFISGSFAGTINLFLLIPSAISNFALAIASRDPKFPMCAFPILVIIAKSGVTARESLLISPR